MTRALQQLTGKAEVKRHKITPFTSTVGGRDGGTEGYGFKDG